VLTVPPVAFDPPVDIVPPVAGVPPVTGNPPAAMPPVLSVPPVDFVPPLALVPPVFAPPMFAAPPDPLAPPVFDVALIALLPPDGLRLPPRSAVELPAIPDTPPVSIVSRSDGGATSSVALQATSNNVNKLPCKSHLLLDIVTPQPRQPTHTVRVQKYAYTTESSIDECSFFEVIRLDYPRLPPQSASGFGDAQQVAPIAAGIMQQKTIKA
jgi:hypothetical protein